MVENGIRTIVMGSVEALVGEGDCGANSQVSRSEAQGKEKQMGKNSF